MPVVAGIAIIMIVFLPLLTLQGLEGKLFAPVALTIMFALAAIAGAVLHGDSGARVAAAATRDIMPTRGWCASSRRATRRCWTAALRARALGGGAAHWPASRWRGRFSVDRQSVHADSGRRQTSSCRCRSRLRSA
jgi:hypothetical protein